MQTEWCGKRPGYWYAEKKISAGATKIRPYEERELHYHLNTMFATNQKQFYQELDGRSNIPNEAPDA